MVTTSKVAERKSRARNRSRAREMRREPSAIENEFWKEVRDRKLDGFKFKRQVLIGPFIADFVCMEEKLVVELDGPLHDKAYDARRDAHMRSLGYRVMRFSNDYVGGDFATVLLMVREVLCTPSPNPLPHPSGGEG